VVPVVFANGASFFFFFFFANGAFLLRIRFSRLQIVYLTITSGFDASSISFFCFFVFFLSCDWFPLRDGCCWCCFLAFCGCIGCGFGTSTFGTSFVTDICGFGFFFPLSSFVLEGFALGLSDFCILYYPEEAGG
jgi:hypothetical protein